MVVKVIEDYQPARFWPSLGRLLVTTLGILLVSISAWAINLSIVLALALIFIPSDSSTAGPLTTRRS
jgi:hypothetical protein